MANIHLLFLFFLAEPKFIKKRFHINLNVQIWSGGDNIHA